MLKAKYRWMLAIVVLALSVMACLLGVAPTTTEAPKHVDYLIVTDTKTGRISNIAGTQIRGWRSVEGFDCWYLSGTAFIHYNSQTKHVGLYGLGEVTLTTSYDQDDRPYTTIKAGGYTMNMVGDNLYPGDYVYGQNNPLTRMQAGGELPLPDEVSAAIAKQAADAP